jgi:hypothetical protein
MIVAKSMFHNNLFLILIIKFARIVHKYVPTYVDKQRTSLSMLRNNYNLHHCKQTIDMSSTLKTVTFIPTNNYQRTTRKR